MLRILWAILVCMVLTGCVATTKIIVKHQFPDEHIDYEIQQGWIKQF